MPEAGELGVEAVTELMGLGAPAQLPCSPCGDLRGHQYLPGPPLKWDRNGQGLVTMTVAIADTLKLIRLSLASPQNPPGPPHVSSEGSAVSLRVRLRESPQKQVHQVGVKPGRGDELGG